MLFARGKCFSCLLVVASVRFQLDLLPQPKTTTMAKFLITLALLLVAVVAVRSANGGHSD